MALDKSFVVRQGLEVATDLFYTNLTTRRVGIGSTFPSTTLDVNGGIGATDLKVAGFATIMHDMQVGASGSVFYISDSSNNVGIGTSIPVYTLDVITPVSTGQTGLHVKGDALFSGIVNAESISVSGVTSFTYVTVDNSLVVTGTGATTTTLNVTGVSTFADDVSFGSTVTFGDNDQIIMGDGPDLKIYHDGSNSYVEDTGAGALIMKGSTLRFRSTTDENMIRAVENSTVELYHNNSKKFETTGFGVTVTGIVSATSYYGDGSNVTGLVTSITAGDFISVDSSTGNVTITGLANTANVSADTLVVTGVSTLGVVTGVTAIEATTYYGDGSNLTGLVTSITAGDFISIDSSTENVTITGLANTANVRADTLVVTGVSTLGIVTGVTAIEATTYYGDGSNLTGVSTANVRADTLVVTGVSTLGVVTGVTAIEATTYYGDGSNLTGLTHSQVGAMGDLVDDTTPQLGGNLDINGKYITGTGGVDITGIITATSFDGTATDASKISVADESSDTTCFPLFAKSATGIVSAFSGSNLTFNSSDGTLSSTSFSGDGSNVTNVDADTVDALHASSFLRSDTASTASGNISFTSTTTPITTNAVKFNNTENDGNYYTDATGVLAFDENFYSDTNYGTGTYDPATVFTGTNGGGILIKNEDGWGAVFTTQNTRFATAEWDGLTVDGNNVLTTADAGAGNGMDADTVDTLHASSFIRSDANSSATGLYSFAAGAYSNNVTYGGRGITAQIDINSTSMRGGVLVRNANDFRSEVDSASFMHYDAYNTSATSYAFRASKGTTLADTFWVKGDGTGYFADDVGIGTTSPNGKLDVLFDTSGGNRHFFTSGALGTRLQRRGDTVGWAMDYGFETNNGTDVGGFGAYGNNTGLLRYYIGSSYLDTKFVIESGGDVGIGINNPGAKLDVYGTARIGGTSDSSRRADFDTNGRLTLAYGDNNNVSNLILANLSSAATTNHGSNIAWDFGTNTSATPITAAAIDVIKSQQWTSTATTRDAKFKIRLATDGSLVDRFEINGSNSVATFNSSEVVFGGTAVSATEGGQIRLTSASGQSNGDTIIDMNSANLRFFYASSPNKGAYLTLSSLANGVGSRILTTSDEGAGNGLDADTLDGQQGSYYRNASNLNAGTIPDARIPDTITPATLVSTKEVRTSNGTELVLNAGESAGKIGSQTAEIIYLNAEGGIRVCTPSVANWGSGYVEQRTNITGGGIFFHRNTTAVGEITTSDTTWLRINQNTAKNIYTPRYIRADGGFFVDGATYGINGTGVLVSNTGATIGGNTAWHAGNDGSGSGLDADTLDGENLVDNAATANTVAGRNGSGDIFARLIRQTYANQSTISGGLVFRVNNSTDNYLRVCSDTSAIRTFLGAAPSASPTFTGNLTIPDAIVHTGDTNTYIQFQSADLFRVVIAGAEVQEWGNNYTKLNDNDTLRLGTGSDFRMHFNGADTFFRNYAHANGDIIFQGETSGGTNQNILIMKTDSTRTYNILYENSQERLRTVSTGVNITGALVATGDVTAFSDITLKENIEVIPNSLDKVSQLRGVTFTRKDLDDKSRKSGVIAQDVEKVLPEVVTTNEDGIKTVAYGNLVGLLIESIKELKAEVAELKEKCK